MSAQHCPTVTVNGEPRAVRDDFTVARAVTELTGRDLHEDGTPVTGGPLGIAVAVDQAVVPRSRWSSTPLTDGQSVEIVTAVQGG